MFQSFWHFASCACLLSGGVKFLFLVWNRFMRHLNIHKHGYPPAHCDADGDFKESEAQRDS